jgi:hypothetical protein
VKDALSKVVPYLWRYPLEREVWDGKIKYIYDVLQTQGNEAWLTEDYLSSHPSASWCRVPRAGQVRAGILLPQAGR